MSLTHRETLETGTHGAVLGAVSGAFEMPNTSPLTLTPEDLQAKLDRARAQTVVRDGALVRRPQGQPMAFLDVPSRRRTPRTAPE